MKKKKASAGIVVDVKSRIKPTVEEKKEVQRDKRLQVSYGITTEHYTAINEAQGGCCKVCNKEDDKLVVDHCHTTHIVRGLICSHCNLGLGHFKDDVEALQSAVNYLQQSRYYEVSGVKVPIKQFSKTPTFRIERDDNNK